MQYYESFELEFSKIYKRLLRLELQIKHKICDSVLSYTTTNLFQEFNQFLWNPKIYEQYRNSKGNNQFIEIRDGIIPEKDKFVKLVNILYLRHALWMIFNEKIFRNPVVKYAFYNIVPTEFKDLLKNRKNLVNLRNSIAHYDFNDYQINKIKYMEALILYEIHIGCSIGKYSMIPANLGNKPNKMVIMKKISELAPDLFNKNIPHAKYPYNKDRMILDMFEDIAVLNGWDYADLASPWDIIRTKYYLKQSK